jgi:hypothetical protein
LADFLERQRDGSQYDAYRGAVGLVYQNLEVLADKIAEDAKQRLQNSAGSDTADSIDRIVLYVDDLDRCAPERVVEVLHAVNLLQVLPLFVAVVSVDAQWLRRSLEFHDRAMFEGVPSAAGAHVGDPLDYLDKIFQIPYSLPPMGRRGAADLVRALVGGQMGESVDDAVHQQKGSTPDLPTNDPGLEVTVDESVSDQEPGIAGRDMRLAETEQDLLAEVAAIVRTPRGVKKLVNLYRLVRVGPQALADPKFADPEGGSGSAVALLLAAVVAMPEAATRLLTALATAPTQDQLLEALEEAIAGHREDNDGDHDDAERCGLCDDLDRLRAEVASLVSRGLVSNDAAAYRDWVNEVARYSFHSARLRDRLADAWADAGRQEG